MGRYAKDTSVSVERSKAEVENTLMRYGATGFFSMWQEAPTPRASIGFQLDGRTVRISIDVPDRNSEEFTLTETGRERSEAQAFKAWEQAGRQRWRALNLIVKAKLEAIECGISTIEREFMADLVLSNNQTFGEWAAPQLETMYSTAKMPPLLPAVRRGK